ncbi:nucleotidyltransferase family protein [Kordiimonas aquimaris]|uniref:nucleotidyltransferase family protein n=1 Tax=Kordiimonas aquimaris TaxID=707591 RepID=UPI0021D3E896|nr:nucleotidyltransferase family protein [Kordiimonas aquimaris]
MQFHAVVMAAQRPGIVNELAAEAGVSHKCLIEIAGKKLVEHVLDNLDRASEIKQITVVIDNIAVLGDVPAFVRLQQAGKARAIEARTDLFSSYLAAIEGDGMFPTLVTTADNVLLSPEMIAHFCTEIGNSGCDAAIALTPKEILLAKYPDGQRRFHEFADGEYSNCNLYALTSERVVNAARVFQTGGQFAKSLYRVLKAFGLWNAFAYRFSLYSLDKAMTRIGKRFNMTAVAVRMPFPEAPIDVDNARSKKLATEILLGQHAA